jgi:uncharacterized membrane protein (DUF485 family)
VQSFRGLVDRQARIGAHDFEANAKQGALVRADSFALPVTIVLYTMYIMLIKRARWLSSRMV